MRDETNQSAQYVAKVTGHFKDGSPLAYQVLAARGQVFAHKAAVQPKRATLGQCYQNAYSLAARTGLYYVEGMAVPREIPVAMDHAWCVDAAGQVYDPTWENASDYFGVAFTQEGLADIYDQTGYHSVFGNLWRLSDLGVEAARALLLGAVQPITNDKEAHAEDRVPRHR